MGRCVNRSREEKSGGRIIFGFGFRRKRIVAIHGSRKFFFEPTLFPEQSKIGAPE
jgi:hypothetical protein